MTSHSVEIAAPDGKMGGFLAAPDVHARSAGVVVIMDAFGVTEHLRSVVERLARAGFVALAPDLYYRETDPVVPYDRRDRAFSKVMRTTGLSGAPEERAKDERALADLGAAVSALGADPRVASPSVGLLGFCIGARLAFLLACQAPGRIAATVCFYGERLVPIVDESRTLRAPLLLLVGEDDPVVPFDHVDRVRAELGYRQKLHEVVLYPGVGHDFFCDPLPTFDAIAAEDAWRRSIAWLGKHLAGS